MRRKREGITREGITLGGQGITEGMLDKLTDATWRSKLERICASFDGRADLLNMTYLDGYTLGQVQELLECTPGVSQGITDTSMLPPETIASVKDVLFHRKRLGLYDDASERWERAVTWCDWDKRGRPAGG